MVLHDMTHMTWCHVMLSLMPLTRTTVELDSKTACLPVGVALHDHVLVVPACSGVAWDRRRSEKAPHSCGGMSSQRCLDWRTLVLMQGCVAWAGHYIAFLL